MEGKKPEAESQPSQSLRQRAEASLGMHNTDLTGMSVEDIDVLVHELQVHQIELEIQNEELREAQLNLAESRDRYSDLYEFAPIGYLTLDLKGRIIEANLAAATMLGVDRKALVGAAITCFIAHESQDDFYFHQQAVMAGDTKQICELTMKRKVGAPLVVRLESIFQQFPDTGTYRCRTALIDVTDLRKTQQQLQQLNKELQQSEARMRAVLNTAIDAIITIDQRGNIQSVNPATERMFGYAEKDMIGKNINMLMPAPYHDEHDSYLRRYLQTGEAHVIGGGREVMGQHKDGSTFPVELAVSEVPHLKLFTGIIRNITERKELEKQIVHIAGEEQTRIGQELHDDVGQEMIGLGMAANAFLTTLTRKASPEAEQAEKLTEGIRRVTDKIRELSRGLIPLEVEPAGLAYALEKKVEHLSEVHGISCKFLCDSPVRFESTDTATHLYNITREACSNAIKHGKATQIQIHLQEKDGMVTLHIRDNGTGIDPAKAAESPGMGLRIMRHRASLISGIFTIEPAEGGGTLVTCTVR